MLNSLAFRRDLKPENLLYVTSDPESPNYNVIKIVDFGLAKLQNEKSNLKVPPPAQPQRRRILPKLGAVLRCVQQPLSAP